MNQFDSEMAEIVETIFNIWVEEARVPSHELDKVKYDSDFISIGGDSVKQIEVLMRIEEHFNITIDDELAYKHRTIESQARLVKELMSNHS